MRRARRGAWALAALTAAWPHRVAAQTDATRSDAEEAPSPQHLSPWLTRPLAVEGLGPATPYGLLGVAADWAAKRWLVINIGIGAGGHGSQLGVTPRLRIPFDELVGLGVEAGVSAGPYDGGNIPFLTTSGGGSGWGWHPFAVWTNTGLVLDERTEAGFHFRMFAGVEWMIYYGAKDTTNPRRLPYAGVALGHAFSL